MYSQEELQQFDEYWLEVAENELYRVQKLGRKYIEVGGKKYRNPDNLAKALKNQTL